jgi:hypothetical protein
MTPMIVDLPEGHTIRIERKPRVNPHVEYRLLYTRPESLPQPRRWVVERAIVPDAPSQYVALMLVHAVRALIETVRRETEPPVRPRYNFTWWE